MSAETRLLLVVFGVVELVNIKTDIDHAQCLPQPRASDSRQESPARRSGPDRYRSLGVHQLSNQVRHLQRVEADTVD